MDQPERTERTALQWQNGRRASPGLRCAKAGPDRNGCEPVRQAGLEAANMQAWMGIRAPVDDPADDGG
jgi:hypothetical protein